MFDYWGFSIAGELSLQHWKLVPRLTTVRFLSAEDLTQKERRHQCLGPQELPELHHHLHLWSSRRHVRCPDVWHSPSGPPVGHDRLICFDGHLALPLRHRQHRGVQHRAERDGVLLPKHVQRRPLRLDARSLPGTHPRDGGRCGELLGSPVQHCIALDCRASARKECECSSLPGGRRCLHLHSCSHTHADQVIGGTELLASQVNLAI